MFANISQPCMNHRIAVHSNFTLYALMLAVGFYIPKSEGVNGSMVISCDSSVNASIFACASILFSKLILNLLSPIVSDTTQLSIEKYVHAIAMGSLLTAFPSTCVSTIIKDTPKSSIPTLSTDIGEEKRTVSESDVNIIGQLILLAMFCLFISTYLPIIKMHPYLALIGSIITLLLWGGENYYVSKFNPDKTATIQYSQYYTDMAETSTQYSNGWMYFALMIVPFLLLAILCCC